METYTLIRELNKLQQKSHLAKDGAIVGNIYITKKYLEQIEEIAKISRGLLLKIGTCQHDMGQFNRCSLCGLTLTPGAE